ncbi:peptidoglycan D,D-transpeptidase FtsI family protein [Sideroxydans lithotrophicus]|uniref:Peptidoglycan D,D-transpeptidase FtsI n=1 Tax=Sideroxydans lithotrophicus (strain ES-1) TaxID=580332 RepID=D5CP29_SIDLE|nr:penicillin-binding protein 2 [Sideroxydans lithotrophicus]ADE12950.1 Peptidoglycan glycosyltransferase [Sideroxydans lithotrophicus ES-1]
MNYATIPIQTTGQIALPAWRSRVLFLLLLGGLFGLMMRAVYLQGIHNDFLRQKGDARYGRVVEIHAHRGMITDRHGEPLAVSTPVESVWASPGDVEITPAQTVRLAQIVGLPPQEVKSKLSDTAREFVYIKRQLPPDQAAKVIQLGIPGISLQREYRRYYPGGEVTSHLIGFTDVDDNGQEGIELALQAQLGGKAGSQQVIKDRRGFIVEDVASLRAPKAGGDVALSIDSKIQSLAFREIKQAVVNHKAKSGSIVVLDAKTGEVLALANWPSYNPNNREKPSVAVLRNRAVTDEYEPGSTMKPFTIATALQAGTIKPNTVINTANGMFTVNGRTIHDTHPDRALSVTQIIQRSSNVGAAKIALSLPPETLWNGLSEDGFGSPTGSEFPGEAEGKLRDYKKWRPIDQATIAYGNGISVNLLQLARAYTVFANDGELKPVTLLKQETPSLGVKVYSAATVQEVRDMMETVVKPGGTAPLAQITGYRVAGKTGTAHKLENGKYVDRYIASFVGLAPASDPRLIVAVKINEPSGRDYYGGEVAAPVFSNVMGATLRMLNVPNDAPLDNVIQSPGEVIGEDA